MILFDFECTKCAYQFEELVHRDTHKVKCPRCSGSAMRMITGTTIDPRLGIHADAFSTMGDKWARIRRERRKIEDKRYADHGD